MIFRLTNKQISTYYGREKDGGKKAYHKEEKSR